MIPTNEQIIAEAIRRRKERGMEGIVLADFIIEVTREGWTPPEPEPVDPDVLAFRKWEARAGCSDKYRKEVLEGKWDHNVNARAYLAGARMAREQERERARLLVEYVDGHAYRPDGVARQVMKSEILAREALAKYRGEA